MKNQGLLIFILTLIIVAHNCSKDDESEVSISVQFEEAEDADTATILTNNELDLVPSGFPLTISRNITSSFGERIDPISKKKHVHDGVDISAPIGEAVIATANGDATTVKDKYGAIVVIIYHENNFKTMYAHLSESYVAGKSKFTYVNKGDTIGLSGNTGYSTGPHLHYEIQYNRKPINPETTF